MPHTRHQAIEMNAQLILATLAKQQHGAVHHDYFEFALFAGMRPSEQIALLWEDVDLRTGMIRVRRARVLGEDKERTKTHYTRDIELNTRALAVIERQRARTQLAGDHVFRNPATGQPWNDEQEQRKAWKRALKLLGGRQASSADAPQPNKRPPSGPSAGFDDMDDDLPF